MRSLQTLEKKGDFLMANKNRGLNNTRPTFTNKRYQRLPTKKRLPTLTNKIRARAKTQGENYFLEKNMETE